jgi:hypothetical protein
MILNDTYSDQPRNKGKILLSVIILAFIFIAIAVFMAYNLLVTPAGSRSRSTSAAQSKSKIIKADTKIGVVKGITYNPSRSCALINETVVHPGDTIHNVTVVEIQHDTVVFAKGNHTWLQKVLDPPNRAWPKHVN